MVRDGLIDEVIKPLTSGKEADVFVVAYDLQEGDVVILSDMSRWDAFDRVRIRN